MKVHEVIMWTRRRSSALVHQMQRWKSRWEKHRYEGLLDRRRSQPSPKRIAVPVLQEVLRLYREQDFDFNVRHFHEKPVEQHHIHLSYTWVKTRCRWRAW